MKAFIAICLVAVAVAEPEADPALLYRTAGYASPFAYSGLAGGYASPYAYSAGYASPYAYSAGFAGAYRSPFYGNYFGGRVFKREAEAEAKPEADPALLYAGLGFNNFAGAYSGYSSYGAFPYASTYSGYPFAYNYAPSVYHAAAPAAVPAVHGGYAAAGRYVANSAGVVHVAKREAEAEADPALLYGSAFAYGSPYASTYSSYGAFPYASAYRSNFAYGGYPYASTYGSYPANRYFF